MQQTVKYTSPITKIININISQFHGIPWNSMELFQVKRDVAWNSMELWKFHGTWCQHQIPWNSTESPDIERKFHGIPWNFKSSMDFGYINKFHEIPRNSMESPYLVWEVPWNSMKLRKFHGTWSDTKFHETLVPPNGLSPSSIEFHGIPWNSGAAKWNITQLHGIPFQMGTISKGCHFKWHKCSMEFRGMFHGIPWNSVPPNEISLSSMEFHGILILSFSSIPSYPELSWDIPWNSMEFHGTLESPNKKSRRIFHGIPWIFGAANWNIT